MLFQRKLDADDFSITSGIYAVSGVSGMGPSFTDHLFTSDLPVSFGSKFAQNELTIRV